MLEDEEWCHEKNKSRRLLYEASSSKNSFKRTKWSWMIAAGVFIIQLTIPTVFSAYGVLLAFLLKNSDRSQLLWRGLLPPVVYITTRSFLDPICTNIFSGQSLKTKGIAIFGVLMMTGSVALNLLAYSECFQILTIGIIGGLSASIVVRQAESVLYSHFPAKQGLTQIFNHLGLALGHFGIPLLMNGLIIKYGVFGSVLLYSGTILQGLLGATILSPPRDSNFLPLSLYSGRPRTHTFDDLELSEFPSGFKSHSGHSPLLAKDRSWKNPAIPSDSRYDVPHSSCPVISLCHKNINGVDILPKIPEESEETTDNSDQESSNDNLFRTHNKRKNPFQEDKFSKNIGQTSILKQDEYNFSQSLQKWRNTSLQSGTCSETNKNSYFENCGNISNFSNHSEDIEELASLSTDHLRFQRLNSEMSLSFFQKLEYVFLCICCNKACFYELYLTIINLPNNIQFYISEPLINALKIPYFFPAVMFHTASCLCLPLFVTFVPFLIQIRTNTSSSQEGAFAISISAFSWLCFLLFSPYLLQSQIKIKRIIYFMGSIFLSTGLYLVSMTRNHSIFALGCAFFGMGHGATLGTVTYMLEEELGLRDFVKVQGPLNCISGCFILLVSVLLAKKKESTSSKNSKILSKINLDVRLRLSSPTMAENTPQQNCVTERRNRALLKSARCMQLDANLPPSHWAEAIATANCVRNRPTRAIPPDITPYEKWTDWKPDLNYLRAFGEKAFILNKTPKGKFEPRGIPAYFVSYSEQSKAYRVWISSERKLCVARYVKFLDEFQENYSQTSSLYMEKPDFWKNL